MPTTGMCKKGTWFVERRPTSRGSAGLGLAGQFDTLRLARVIGPLFGYRLGRSGSSRSAECRGCFGDGLVELDPRVEQFVRRQQRGHQQQPSLAGLTELRQEEIYAGIDDRS